MSLLIWFSQRFLTHGFAGVTLRRVRGRKEQIRTGVEDKSREQWYFRKGKKKRTKKKELNEGNGHKRVKAN